MSEYKLVNPDMMLSGATLSEECAFPMKPMIVKNGAPDSDLDCPYDGTYCRQKDYRYTNWVKAIEYASVHKANRTFVTTEDMFTRCPLPDGIECIRKIRYEKIRQTACKGKVK